MHSKQGWVLMGLDVLDVYKRQVILPLAFILSKILGAAGVWHAFWITEVVVAGISYVICKKEIFQ